MGVWVDPSGARGFALCPFDHLGQTVIAEVDPHVFADFGPYRQQDALSFVVAGAVLMRLTEIARLDRAVDSADDLRQRDRFRLAGQDIAASDAALRPHQPGTFQRQEDLLEVGLRKAGPRRDVTNRLGRRLLRVKGER